MACLHMLNDVTLQCRVDDESEFFTLGGSLLASGTGEVGFVTAQANKKAKKRRRSEAVATDAPVERQHAQALQQSRDQTASRPKSNANAAAAPNSNANSAAAPKSNATSAAAAKSSTHTAAAGPASAGNAGNSKGWCSVIDASCGVAQHACRLEPESCNILCSLEDNQSSAILLHICRACDNVIYVTRAYTTC